MQVVAPVTQKGQITIPASFRHKLNIAPYDKVSVSMVGDVIQITPTTDILDLAGTVKAPPGKTVLEARKAMEQSYSRI